MVHALGRLSPPPTVAFRRSVKVYPADGRNPAVIAVKMSPIFRARGHTHQVV